MALDGPALLIGRNTVGKGQTERREEAVLDVVQVERADFPVELDVIGGAHVIGETVIEDTRLVCLDLVDDGRLGAVFVVIGGVFYGRVAGFPHPAPVRGDIVAVDAALGVGDSRPYGMGGQESELGNLGSDAVPNDLNVTLAVQLQVEAQLPEDVVVGVLKQAFRLQPLVRLLFPVGGFEAIAVDHLRNPIHDGGLDTRTEVQVPEVIAVEVVETVIHPIAAHLLREQGELVGREPEDVEFVSTHSR